MSVGVFTPAGTGTDILDAVVTRCAGEPLRIDNVGDGGETDHLHNGQVSARDVRRLRAAGLVSNRAGLYADQLAEVAGWTGTADEFVSWYCDSCITGLDMRAEARTGIAWHEQERPDDDAPEQTGTVGTLPFPILEYLMRLVHAPKAEYAGAYAYHIVHGHPCPADPGTEWADKARRKLDALHRRGVTS